MRSFLPTIILSLVSQVQCQCDNQLPDGSICGPNDVKDVVDPEACSKFYRCQSGCVTHETCPDTKLFDEHYSWCQFPDVVECGSRPCTDPAHCFTTTTRSTTTDCGHILDCEEAGDGWWPDPFNCRKYWHCYKGEGEHLMCPDDQVFDLVFTGCNWLAQTDCGDRPICGPCDEDCVDPPTLPPDCTPPDHH